MGINFNIKTKKNKKNDQPIQQGQQSIGSFSMMTLDWLNHISYRAGLTPPPLSSLFLVSDAVAQSQTSVDEGGRLCQLSRWMSKNERRGGQKLQAKKMKNVDADAVKCAKITDTFAAGEAAVPSIMQQQVEGGEVAHNGHCQAEEQASDREAEEQSEQEESAAEVVSREQYAGKQGLSGRWCVCHAMMTMMNDD